MHRVRRVSTLRVALAGMGLLVLLPLVISNSGCTLIGIAIGVAGSADAPPERLPASSVLKVSPGALVIVATKDEKEYSGVYLGRRLVEDTSYTSRYRAWGDTSRRAPALGGVVEIELEDGAHVHGVFDGFTYRAARVRVGPSLEPETFAFNRVRWLQADSLEGWTGEDLARLDVAGEIPTREAIRVGIVRPFSWSWQDPSGIAEPRLDTTDYAEQVELPVDRVSAILVHGRSAAPLVLGLIGLVADILVVKSWNDEIHHSTCAGPSGPAPTISYVEHSEDDFLPAAGVFVPPALAIAGADSACAARAR